jgi:hypothetical protein
MSIVLALGLAAAAFEPALPQIEHRTRLEHAGTVVEAHYRTRVSLHRRQVGAVSKAGTPSTLRCLWRADLRIERQARYGTGVRLDRGMQRESILRGARPGWCSASRKVIAREVAAREQEIRTHLVALAREDEKLLRAELGALAPGSEG